MKTVNKAIIIFLILFSCVGCDQATKKIVKQNLVNAQPMSFLSDIVRIQYAQNQGGFLSLGNNIPENMRQVIFVFLTGAFLLVLLIYLIRSKKIDLPNTLALSLILAGGIGNLIDRVLNDGQVVDFLILGIGPISTGVFNVADVAITAGAIGFAAFSLSHRSFTEKTG